ncbi:MAG: tetratricopeptide repeat protein [Burkholderiales bacterium]
MKAARGRAGLTQEALGAPDLGKSFVSLLESGNSYPSVETTVTLSRRARVSVASLLFDSAELRLETAFNLIQLAWDMDPTSHGAEAVRLAATAEALLPDMPVEMRVRTTLTRARVAMAANRVDEAARFAQEAAGRARRCQLGSALGMALCVKGIVEERRGLFRRAVVTLEHAIDLMRRTKSIRTEEGIWALLSLGAARLQMNEVKRAQRAYRRAQYLAERLEMPRLHGRALTGLGLIEWAAGRLDQAVDLLSRAYEVFEQAEDLAEMGRALTNLGCIRRGQSLYAEALSVLEKALRIRERQADLRGCSATRDEIAAVLLAMGRLGEAAAAARQAINDARAAGDQARAAVAKVTMARVLHNGKQRARAVRLLRDAVAGFDRLGMTKESASASDHLRSLVAEPGKNDDAPAPASRLVHRI